jgi:multidrug efflux pump subunit AcrA (membrane-fusion protein)
MMLSRGRLLKKSVQIFSLSLLLALLLTACGATSAEQIPPTPTPLPPDPALEKQTYTITRGPIERTLEVTGKVTPVDQAVLSFRRTGRIETIGVQRGDKVKAGDVLAQLQQDDQIDERRIAEDALVQRQRELERARRTQARLVRERTRALEQANEALKELLPGGENDVLRAAQDEVEKAERAVRDTRDAESNSKTDAEKAVRDSSEALIDAQRAWSKAYWDNEWVKKYGTDPAEPTIPDPNNPARRIPNKISDEQRDEFADKLRKATTALRDAEQVVERAQQSFDRSRVAEIEKIQDAEKELDKQRRALDRLINGRGSKAINDAREAVEQARTALDEAQQGEDIDARIKAVEDAQRELDRKRKRVEDGQLIAPRDGEVVSIRFSEGDQVQEFEPVLEIADPSRLEFAAQLSSEQTRQISEGQPAEIRLLARPDVPLLAIVRRLPGGPASGGSLQDRDPTTRFEVTDAKGIPLRLTEVGRIRVVLERKDNVLLLPLEAVRTFEGRRFVVVRDGVRERRVPVRVGITTEGAVELLEGVNEGDVVVGP